MFSSPSHPLSPGNPVAMWRSTKGVVMGQNPICTRSVNINTWLVNGCTSRKIMVFTNIFRLWSILISRCARFKTKEQNINLQNITKSYAWLDVTILSILRIFRCVLFWPTPKISLHKGGRKAPSGRQNLELHSVSVSEPVLCLQRDTPHKKPVRYSNQPCGLHSTCSPINMVSWYTRKNQFLGFLLSLCSIGLFVPSGQKPKV